MDKTYNINKITQELKEYFPIEITTENNNKIILKGEEVDDFELFMEELNNILPEEYTFKNELKGENFNICEITIIH